MDFEFGTNTSCVILSLMGVDNRPRKKLIQEHKRVLSDEYHQRVASMASHVRRSPFKCYSFGTSQNCETSEASTAVGPNKRCKMSIDEEEEVTDVVSDEKKASGGMGLVDELISGIYSSHNTARQYTPFDNLSEPLTNLRAQFSRKRSLGSSYEDNRDENCSADLFCARLGCLPKSQSSAASSVIYRGRESVKGWDNVASERTAESEVAVGEVHVEAKDGERLPRNPYIRCMPTSCFISKRNCGPSPAYLSVDATEQETSLNDLEDSFYTKRSSIDNVSFKSFEDKYLHSPDSVLESCDEEMLSGIIAKVSEHGTQLHSFGFDPSTAWSGEFGTTVLSDEVHEDQCGGGYNVQDNSRPARISESREFNYLVDILTEAGFCRKNLTSSLDKWHSLVSPLSPFVFETVEKRYTDDKSWKTSDRVLLFDRMNSWLEGILRRSMLFPLGHVSARISDRFRHDIDEEALWSSLVKEGKDLKGETIEDLLESDLGSLDLAEYIESIVAEIEWSVIDELVAELVSE